MQGVTQLRVAALRANLGARKQKALQTFAALHPVAMEQNLEDVRTPALPYGIRKRQFQDVT